MTFSAAKKTFKNFETWELQIQYINKTCSVWDYLKTFHFTENRGCHSKGGSGHIQKYYKKYQEFHLKTVYKML